MSPTLRSLCSCLQLQEEFMFVSPALRKVHVSGYRIEVEELAVQARVRQAVVRQSAVQARDNLSDSAGMHKYSTVYTVM